MKKITINENKIKIERFSNACFLLLQVHFCKLDQKAKRKHGKKKVNEKMFKTNCFLVHK